MGAAVPSFIASVYLLRYVMCCIIVIMVSFHSLHIVSVNYLNMFAIIALECLPA